MPRLPPSRDHRSCIQTAPPAAIALSTVRETLLNTNKFKFASTVFLIVTVKTNQNCRLYYIKIIRCEILIITHKLFMRELGKPPVRFACKALPDLVCGLNTPYLFQHRHSPPPPYPPHHNKLTTHVLGVKINSKH